MLKKDDGIRGNEKESESKSMKVYEIYEKLRWKIIH